MDQSNIAELNNVCVFCFKTIREIVQLGNNDGSQTVDKFCNFLRRICTKPFNVPGSSTQLLATCGACVNIMDSFNELYHKIQCLQLQMEWRLDKLKNVMKCADKVPSRVKDFRKRYDVPNVMQSNGTVDEEEYKHLISTRNVIKLQMTEYLANITPRVRLEDCITNSKKCNIDNNVNEPRLNPLKTEELRFHLNFNPLLGWLKTVIAVTICSIPVVRRNHKPVFTPVALKNSPKLVSSPDNFSELEASVNEFCKNVDLTEEKYCPEVNSSLVCPSLDSFEDTTYITTLPLPHSVQVGNCRMEEDGELNDIKFTPSNTLHSQLSSPVLHLKTEGDAYDYPNSLCSSLDIKITSITDPDEEHSFQNEEHEPCSTQNSGEQWHGQMLSIGDVRSEFNEPVPSTSRPLRSKFKCKGCSVSFSTSTRLAEHSKSCTSTNNEYRESEEEDDFNTSYNDNEFNDSNYNTSSNTSENKCKQKWSMKKESSSDCSDEENMSDIKPNKVIIPKSPCETDSRSLEECLEVYKKTNGQGPLSEKNVATLKLTATDIQLKGFEYLEPCKLPECDSGLFSKDDLKYHHQSLHGRFQCYFCYFTSNFAMEIASHEFEHNSYQENGWCPRCQEVKVEVSDYKKHFVAHHLETSVKYRYAQCPVCSISFPGTDQVPLCHFVNEHDISRLNDPDKVFSCDEDNCSAYFLTAKQLIGHFKITHNKTKQMHKGKAVECLIECDICHLKFPRASTLNLHKMRKHRTNNDAGLLVITNDGLTINDILCNRNMKIPCLEPSCNLKFFAEEDRVTHFKHHGIFKCSFCSVEKTFAPDLALHELEHADSHKFPLSGRFRTVFGCRRCAFSSIYKSCYIDHHLLKHLKLTPYTPTIKCPICKQSFKGNKRNLKRSLLRHFLKHHDKSVSTNPATLFNCVHCSAYFLAQKQLHLHNKRMHPEHVHRLSTSSTNCNGQFRTRRNINFYMNSDHQGHLCEQCGKRFKRKSHLVLHLLYHGGPDSWQFTCDICSRKCATKYHLTRHRRTHLKLKLYICDTCGAAYAQRHVWRHHVLRQHGKLDFFQKRAKTASMTLKSKFQKRA